MFAACSDEKDGIAREVARQIAEQLATAGIRPLDIIEHDHKWYMLLTCRDQRIPHCFSQAKLL
jgi:hypothetical protein